MENEKSVDVLNKLVTINNDRIEGYETALKETDEEDLITLFNRFISTSRKCKQELVSEVYLLGGEEAEGTKVSGKFFRAWMNVKSALTGKDRKALLNSCEFGEDEAVNTYEQVLKNDNEHLSGAQRILIMGQKTLIKADHDHVKSLRDALAEA